MKAISVIGFTDRISGFRCSLYFFLLYVLSVLCDRLLVSDCLDRVEVGCFLGRIPSEEDPGDGAHSKRQEYTPGLDEDGPMGNAFHEPAGTTADDYSDKAAGDTDQDGFYQELAQDVDSPCTD